jgi:hypothetical protein
MVEGEDENFLRFATALKILVGRSVRLEQLERVKTLLKEYLLTFAEVTTHQYHDELNTYVDADIW